ncbi:hypothetical protein AMATHDRAFT_66976 [Amanita thiersii Skay4041]|uniref:Acid phosphatase n=1 Tax=Amanita thiersii Skay4041 TaxID=703135 RepID=A0A2A9N9T0_9AGAR|nr:hypothetical protein AMATHDRAFT_66976 [Amanita thiersii Skay4041]
MFSVSFVTLALLLALTNFTAATQVNPDSINTSSLTQKQAEEMNFGLNLSNNAAVTPPFVYRPPQVPLEVEQYPVAPNGLELEQVHIYIRHGERTPVGVRLAGPPANIPENWIMCKTVREFQAAVSQYSTENQGDDALWSRRGVERRNGTTVDGECLLGGLTDTGRQSTFNYGAALRRLYVDKLSFLPDKLATSGEIYLRSTNMPRTMESLQHVLHGIYPISKCDPSALPPILLRNGKDENLYGNTYACKRLELLQLGFAKAAAAAYNPTLEPLDNKVSKYIGGNPVRLDGKPRASGIMDTIRAAVAHGIRVPPEFEDKVIVDTIERGIVAEWFAGTYKTEEVRRLGMGPLLSDVARKMQQKADKRDQDPLKLLIHATHDTAIAAICATLDVFDDLWPAFTASVTFELFKKSEQEDAASKQGVLSSFMSRPAVEHYVRMRYQNKNMALPACAEEGKHLPGHPEFCTLAAFRERIRQLTPVDWETECSISGRS